MDTTMSGTNVTSGNQPMGASASEPAKHKEGPVALSIEQQTAKLPSDLFLWAAVGSIIASATLQFRGRREISNFVGQWAPTFLVLGLYNKIVKVMGSDRIGSIERANMKEPMERIKEGISRSIH